MKQLSVKQLQVSYDETKALIDVDFEVEEGEFFCVVGPTNAGKSTLLKTIAGLVRPDRGMVSIKGVDVTRAQPKDRNVSLLFQNIALFPNLTGFENIAFPLRSAGFSDNDIGIRVEELGELLGVSHVFHRFPRTFSGGEQQRVAIGRSIAKQSDLLMLDEPLTNLDARLRIALRIEFKEIHRQLGQTVVYVTHDQIEAMSMSDRIAVLNEGRFQQIGTPDEIYNRPANRLVAEFIGQPSMNFLKAEIVQQEDVPAVRIGKCRYPLPLLSRLEMPAKSTDRLAMGVRPEAIRVSREESADTPHHAQITWVEHLGSKSVLDLKFGDESLKVTVSPDDPASDAQSTWFGFDPQPDLLLNRDSGIFFR